VLDEASWGTNTRRMRDERGYDVCSVVVSDLAFDARVRKEASTLTAAGYRVVVIGCAYELETTRRRRGEGADFVQVPLGSRAGSISILSRAKTLLRLWLAAIRTPARAYHAHNIHPLPAAWLASKIRRARLVYDAHELYGESADPGRLAAAVSRLNGALERFAVRRSDVVITTNRLRASVLKERHEREILVLENVPRLVQEIRPLDPGFPAGKPTLLYQGGIYAIARGFRETIQALHELDDVHFVVLGFGREHDLELIRRWAAEEGLEERVHLFPPRPPRELVRTAACATVGLVPIRLRNTSSLTGDTNKLFEYLMAGIPVAASDLPEIRRVISAGRPPVGEFFDVSSPASIAEAVRRILADPEEYKARRREARRLAVERYNWEAQEPRLLQAYRTILDGAAADQGHD
jgi:glycosyltransferase involved in cell wall biosynthesis